MNNKPMYDLVKGFRTHAEVLSYGYFEKKWEIGRMSPDQPFPAENFVLIETEKAIFRTKKEDLNSPKIVEFFNLNKPIAEFAEEK